MFLFHEIFLSAFLLFFIYKIITSISIVESVLFLILLAINLSIFLFYLCSNFLGILYLAIYIGAVTVFFLFVVMMTDLSSIEPNAIQKHQQNINFLISVVSSIFLSNLIFNLYLSKQPWVSFFLTHNKSVRFDNIDFFYTNIEEIGLALLNEHSGPFVLVSLAILVALIGAIFLTSIAKQATNNYFFLSAIDLKFLNSAVFLNIFLSSLDFNLKYQDMENQIVRSFLNSVNLTNSN
jgi:NADH:ubiquinone oxidoreductase subunit 6 (subunit J)